MHFCISFLVPLPNTHSKISRPRDPSTPSTEEPSTAKGKNKKDKKLKDKKMKKKEEKSKKPDAAPEEPSSVSAPAPATATPATTSKDQTPFQAYYLRSLTTSFSDDLDALRSAPDFSTNSLPVLVNALVQGADLYSAEDQVRIMGGNAA